MSQEQPIRILIAEDQEAVRRSAALLLATQPDMCVVGEACNGAEAVELAARLAPDVVLMDLHMPVKGGVAATREIMQRQPRTQILVLTTLNDDETVFEAVRAGAHAYLLKDAEEDELLDTVRALRRGESRLTPQIARKVMDQFRRLAEPAGAARSAGRRHDADAAERAEGGAAAHGNAAAGAPGPAIDALTEKEERVLEQLCEGLSNRQIAQALHLAEGTVKNYVSRIMEKLHANTRTELAVRTRRP